MPVLQWSLLFLLSLLLSLFFLFIHLPGPLLLGSMIVGIIFSMRGISLHPPRCTFLGAQAILGCMIAQNLTGSILTTLTAHLADGDYHPAGDPYQQRGNRLAAGSLQ